MKFRYGALPSNTGQFPVVPLDFPDVPGLRIPGLVDSGAGGVRVSAALADPLGIDLTQHPRTALTIGGRGNLTCYVVPEVRLQIRGQEWLAPVGFVDPWDFGHAVLGTVGFFDAWHVRFDARLATFNLRRSRS